MTTQRGSDEGTQPNRQQHRSEQTKGVPAHPFDIAQEYTVKLDEDVLPVADRPTPAARRPAGITDAPTTLLSQPSQPQAPTTKPPAPSETARPAQPPGSLPAQKNTPPAPRSGGGVLFEPKKKKKRDPEP